jgi:aspartate/methionine/tyrosine aminotransferase
MNNDMLLAKIPLPEGWIDMGIGEAAIVREEFFYWNSYSLGHQRIEKLDLSYQPANGWTPLSEYLEAKHGKPVVIANGAKQALMAVFAAAEAAIGKKRTVVARSPYWSSFPRMSAVAGMMFSTESNFLNGKVRVLVSPNNPTGVLETIPTEDIRGALAVHDAAYWSQSYNEKCTNENLPYCNIRIYSMSKMLGMSSLRVGYAVLEDDAWGLREQMIDYIETTTSGVSESSQRWVLGALKALDEIPDGGLRFYQNSRSRLAKNRFAFESGLGSAGTSANDSGMFAWVLKGPGYDPDAAKVRVIDGAAFGDAKYFRASLGGSLEDCREAGKRLGKAAEEKLCREQEERKRPTKKPTVRRTTESKDSD